MVQLFDGESWVDWKPSYFERYYLFDTDGIEKGYIGMAHDPSGSANATKTNNEIYCYSKSLTNQYGGTSFRIYTADLTNATRIKVVYRTCSGTTLDYCYLHTSVRTISNSYYNSDGSSTLARKVTKITGLGYPYTTELDVSSISGEKYVYIGIETNGTSTQTAYISEAWIE